MKQTSFLPLFFFCLALLALTMACFLCSSLISIPAKKHIKTPSGQNISNHPLFQTILLPCSPFLWHLPTVAVLRHQWKEFSTTHPSLGLPWLCVSPWQRPVTTSACPGPSCSTARTQTPGWRRGADAEHSSGSGPGLGPARRARPPPRSGPYPAVHGSGAGLYAGRLFYSKPTGGQTGRSCAVAFCLVGRLESAHQSGSAPSCAPARQVPETH